MGEVLCVHEDKPFAYAIRADLRNAKQQLFLGSILRGHAPIRMDRVAAAK